ncbi:MAG: hypothetical protein E6X52_01030 [Actinomyces sp.]|uniref:hypothetical protein n=1 Tax=Actinomyces sp. TaxID=29317 RepID=UPI0028038C03|nr:hypothetical protein [Actinomyces sp.]MDU4831115.1 hypothetical protein [Actinomyces sp.]MDU6757675.1 hypothetical protein [Actinomyces sp.]
MSKVRIEWNEKGFREVLKSVELAAATEAEARRIARAAGGEDDYSVQKFEGSYGGSPRVMHAVKTATDKARKAQAEDETLTRALYGG